MVKLDKDGNIYEEAHPGFTSNPTISSTLIDFNIKYNEHQEKVMNDFLAFNANGSGWILNRVNSVSLHLMQYVRPTSPSTDHSDIEDEDDFSYF